MDDLALRIGDLGRPALDSAAVGCGEAVPEFRLGDVDKSLELRVAGLEGKDAAALQMAAHRSQQGALVVVGQHELEDVAGHDRDAKVSPRSTARQSASTKRTGRSPAFSRA